MAQIPLKSIKFPGLPDTYTIDGGLSEEAKAALLACFENVAWANESGQNYYDALHDALYPATGLVSISAVFTQGSAVINEGDDLNTLKQYLVVTGYYGDGVSQVITDYALSGQLTEGTSTITVTKEGKTATFTVTVTGDPVLTVYVGRGADLNNMDQTVSLANRCISEKISFTNIAPITVQWEENTSYRFVLKNILPNGKGDNPDNYVWMPDYNTQLTGDNTLFGWINSNVENTFSNGKNNLLPVAYDSSSGYARIIFAAKSSMSDPLPSALPSGHITINGTRYKIQTVQQ